MGYEFNEVKLRLHSNMCMPISARFDNKLTDDIFTIIWFNALLINTRMNIAAIKQSMG